MPPFYSDNTKAAYQRLLTEPVEFPDAVASPAARDFIRALLQARLRPRLRPRPPPYKAPLAVQCLAPPRGGDGSEAAGVGGPGVLEADPGTRVPAILKLIQVACVRDKPTALPTAMRMRTAAGGTRRARAGGGGVNGPRLAACCALTCTATAASA